ncbi:MAG: ankyrin repeat domain-containing protein [Pyrinomonadaceae bacterium]
MQKKSFIDSIKVADPCTEKWDEMTGNDRVRFCSHCAKDVNNISEMTRKEVERLVRKSGGRLCVRYRVDPKTHSPEFAQRVSAFARHGVAAGALGASLLAAGAYAQTASPQQALIQIERVERSGDASSKISGYVTDPNGAAIPYAIVSIINDETLTSQVQNASAEGFYEFKYLTAGKYKMHFEGGGFAARDIMDIYVSDASELRHDGQLALAQMNEVVQVGGDQEKHLYTVDGGAVISSYETRNELVAAVLREDFENVKARIVMRAKVNVKDKVYDGISPLHAAVETGNMEIAEYLLAHGAKPNIRDSFKRTPLMMMDEDATPEMFQLLIRYGAKPNLLDKEKNTILHHLAENGVDQEVVRQAALYGGNVNAVNKAGSTALMAAVDHDASEIAKVLIESGSDLNARNREGRTALDMAADKLVQTRSLLETYGAVRGGR